MSRIKRHPISAAAKTAHPSCAPVTVQQAIVFNKRLRVDCSSPSGLMWKHDNNGIASAFRRAGSVAGSQNNRGVWRVGIDGKAWACSVIIRAINALNDRREGV